MGSVVANLQDVPNLSMKHLRAVVALARFGSFVAAASYLRISQPGLSRVIQQAEAMLGVKLFTRGTRSVTHTEAGREFVPVAERLLGELLQQSQKVRSGDSEMRGQIIISSLMSISHHVLPSALVAFRKKHPKMHVQIREGLASAVQEDVRSGIADFGIGSVVGLTEGIVIVSAMREACYVVMPKGHHLGRLRSVSLQDIGDEPMISMPADSGLRRTLDMTASERGVVFNHSIITNQFGSLFDYVAHGLGIAIVPAAALPPSAGFSLMVKPLRPAIIRRIGIIRLSDRAITPSSQAFLDIFQPKFFAAIRKQQKGLHRPS